MTLIDKTKQTKPRTHVCMILDSSGSMGMIKQEAINHFNEQIEDLRRKSTEHDIDVSLLTFNWNVDLVRKVESVDSIQKLTELEYQPNGGTALYDAIGYGISTIQKNCDDLEDKNTAVLFLIITDGQENSSNEFNQAKIKSLFSDLEPKGWTFTFMAANVDPMSIVQDYGLSASNVAIFTANAVGMAHAGEQTSLGNTGYFAARSVGVRTSASFYDQDEKEDSEESEVKLVDSTS